MSDLEKRLPSDRFMRVHRSYIISMEKITGIEGDEVLLDKVVRIPIGDTYSEEFTKVIEGSIFFKDKDSATLIDKRLTN